MNEFEKRERERLLDKARAAEPLSTVFFLVYIHERLGSSSKQLSTDLRSIFGDIDSGAVRIAIEAAHRLLSASYVGAAYFKYPNSMEYDQAVERLKNENPGFSEECYEVAIWTSISGMR